MSFAPPSPCSTDIDRGSSVPPSRSYNPTLATKMLKIDSLLNPVTSEATTNFHQASTATPPPTPASFTHSSPPRSVPLTKHINMATNNITKRGKDATALIPGKAKQPIRYAPYEGQAFLQSLSIAERNELDKQLRHFQIYPSNKNGEGKIAEYQKHFPYSSQKKDIFNNTSKTGFEVFQYRFTHRHTSGGKAEDWWVMWDYQVGLVRITPFFKALGHPKTVPKKAIDKNKNLIDLCPSVTGGALDAQGYWMPFACARALCATFCYDIRWALTPIFGMNFVNQCLPRGHSNYEGYTIPESIIQSAMTSSSTWRNDTNPAASSSTSRRVPSPVPSRKKLRVRSAKRDTNVSPEAGQEIDPSQLRTVRPVESPPVSPKSVAGPSGWAAVNGPGQTNNVSKMGKRPLPSGEEVVVRGGEGGEKRLRMSRAEMMVAMEDEELVETVRRLPNATTILRSVALQEQVHRAWKASTLPRYEEQAPADGWSEEELAAAKLLLGLSRR